MDILLTLLALTFLWFLWNFVSIFMHEYKKIKSENEAALQKDTKKEIEFLIAERFGCIGKYDGKDISSHIKLEDGRMFEYASLAYKSPQGFYISKDPDVPHIRVDGNLLYKLISDK